jgi:7-cyano-7-deazaguanine synthase
MKKAIVLLSGGMDSAVTLYAAKQDHACKALIFHYGQKAVQELDYAVKLAELSGTEPTLVNISMPWGGSALLDEGVDIPKQNMDDDKSIPATYVPGRNIIFLSYAVSYAEVVGAESIFIGAHQLDYSNYPDCREDFLEAFQGVINKGTKGGVEGNPVEIKTPILNMSKKEIVELGKELEVPFEHTWSCYKDGEKPCGECESCFLRAKGFAEAGIVDPITAA